VLGDSPGTSTQKVFTQGEEQILRLVSGEGAPCQLSGAPFFTMTNFAYAEVHNPGAKAARVELGVGSIPGAPELQLPLLAAYASLPTSDSERAACLTGAEISCSAGIAAYEVCLNNEQAVTIPAGGSIWAYIGNFSADDPPTSFILFAHVLSFD
jgi:hypothetical protein